MNQAREAVASGGRAGSSPAPLLRAEAVHKHFGGIIAELRRVFEVYKPAIPYYNLRQVDACVPPLDDWLREHPPRRGA